MREKENVLVVYPSVRTAMDVAATAPVLLDATKAAGFPRNFVISEKAALTWSDDNRRVFLGIIGQGAAPDTARRKSTDSVADVDVWRTMDERVQSQQMIRADQERNFTFRQAFDLSTAKFVQLSDSSMRDLEVGADGRWAVGRDARAYVSDYERPRADIYRVNTSTGERTLMLRGQTLANNGAFVFGIAPNGRHYVYWNDGRFHAYDLESGSSKTLAAGPDFTDTDFDHPGVRPPFGIAGYSADGKSVIASHKFDLWVLPLDGAGSARNLTNGAGSKDSINFRWVRSEPVDPMAARAARDPRVIDLAKPLMLAAFGEWTKNAGFYRLANGKLEPIVYEAASYGPPTRAAKADRYIFTRSTFAEYPDLRMSSSNFAEAKKISDANPQQSDFKWGRTVLFDYTIKDGTKLQGFMMVPDDYRQGEKRPMIVSFYEKNSQNLNRYVAPSFITGMGALPIEALSRGYITMFADIHYHTGSSHSDQLEAVEAATKKVIELGYADPGKIGLNGHSYGGEGAAFIATRSKMFAAVGVGAGVTDLYTDFTQSWGWSYQVNSGSGANAFDYYMYGQGRWGFSPWDKPDVYRFESALTHVPLVSSPILIMHGTADPTVSFQEGLNFYQALRFNKKEAILLAYPGEGHGLRGWANRRDLTVRYFQFFDHYLRGVPAPAWMKEGVPFLVKDAVKVLQ
jgi:dienelactone hydrolase